MKIEIELPERKGFEYTGEFRKPKTGEWGYCYREDKTFRVYSNLVYYRPCHILKEIQAAKPKVESFSTQERLQSCLKKIDEVSHELGILFEMNQEK